MYLSPTIFIFEKGCLPLLISLGELPFSGVPNYLCLLCIKTTGQWLAVWPMYTTAAFFLWYGVCFHGLEFKSDLTTRFLIGTYTIYDSYM